MSVQIVDCTIRDGGYLFGKNPKPKFIKGIIEGLVEAGIDFVETGFLQSNVMGESLVYKNSTDVVEYLPVDKENTQFLGFCDNSRYSLECLNDYDGRSFGWIRLSFAKHEIDDAVEFCAGIKEKGYSVQFNPMDSIGYSDAEREELIKKVNLVKPASFSIVDTFGSMNMMNLVHIFKQIDNLLDKDIKIGLHSHDNLGLSCALAERMIELSEEMKRDIIVDGSLAGMGRGAGNAKTELLADYINKNCNGNYNIQKLLKIIDEYIIPESNNVQWGYDLSMYISGTMRSHVDNVYHLKKEYGCTVSEMYDVIEALTQQQRIRYGVGYSKEDFTYLDAVYHEVKSEKVGK